MTWPFLSLNKNGLFFRLEKEGSSYVYFINIISFYQNKKFLFLFNSKKKLTYFINQLSKGLKQLIYGYYIEILLKGVGFSIFLYKNKYIFFDLGFSHFICLKIPKNIIIKRFKNRFVIFGFNKMEINNFYKVIKDLKSFDFYKGKGFMLKNQKIKLKEIVK